MRGGGGDDVYIVDNLQDQVIEAATEGRDTVRSSIDYVLGANLEDLVLLEGAISGTGNALANSITGNSAVNVLDGKAGLDSLNGGEGSDIYLIGLATDHAAEVGDVGHTGIDSRASGPFTAMAAGRLGDGHRRADAVAHGSGGVENLDAGTATKSSGQEFTELGELGIGWRTAGVACSAKQEIAAWGQHEAAFDGAQQIETCRGAAKAAAKGPASQIDRRGTGIEQLDEIIAGAAGSARCELADHHAAGVLSLCRRRE